MLTYRINQSWSLMKNYIIKEVVDICFQLLFISSIISLKTRNDICSEKMMKFVKHANTLFNTIKLYFEENLP